MLTACRTSWSGPRPAPLRSQSRPGPAADGAIPTRRQQHGAASTTGYLHLLQSRHLLSVSVRSRKRGRATTGEPASAVRGPSLEATSEQRVVEDYDAT